MGSRASGCELGCCTNAVMQFNSLFFRDDFVVVSFVFTSISLAFQFRFDLAHQRSTTDDIDIIGLVDLYSTHSTHTHNN